MNLDYWQEFVVLSRYMNVSEAARHLHLSQPTLSNHLASLEREMGSPLLARGKTLHLTPAGRMFLRKAPAVLAAYEDALSAVADAPEEDLVLKIACSAAGNSSEVSYRQIINGFLSTNPLVLIESVDALESTAFDVLQDASIDCAIVYVTPIESDKARGIVYEKMPSLVPNRLGLWMDKDNPLANRESLKWEDCNGLVFPMYIGVPLWCRSCQQILENHHVNFQTRIVSEPPLNAAFAYWENEVTLLDEYIRLQSYFVSVPNMVFVPFDEPDAFSETYVAYREGKTSEALDIFLKYLRQQKS